MQRTLYLPLLVLAVSAHAQQAYPDHVIQNVDWSSGTHHTAVTLPIVSPAVPTLPTSIAATADAEFVSGTSVHLLPGFHAGAFTGAGRFRAHIDEGLGQPADVVIVAPDTAMPIQDNVVHVPKWEKLEIGLKLPELYRAAIDSFFTHYYPNGTATAATPGAVDALHDLNPYADDSLQVYLKLTRPSGTRTLKWGFYMREARWTDSTNNQAILMDDTSNVLDPYAIRFRFAPDEEGPWQYELTAKAPFTRTPSGQSLPVVFTSGYAFVCDPPLPDNKGHLSVNDTNHRTLKFETGESFFGLGTNMADVHRSDAGYGHSFTKRDFKTMKLSMEQLHDVGGNYLRMYLIRHVFAPEWVNLGVYDRYRVPPVCDLGESLDDPNCDTGWSTDHVGNCQYQCWAFDKMVDQARASNIYIQLCIDPYGPVIGNEKLLWGAHPYVINYLDVQPARPYDVKEFFYTNGDPDSTASGVFYYWKRKYKYILSRWGYSVNLPIIEPFNEVDQLLTYRDLEPGSFGDSTALATCSWPMLQPVPHRDLCRENRFDWPQDTVLPTRISDWLTDITDHVRAPVDLGNPIVSPLGESKKLFLMSYAWCDPHKPDRGTFYKPFNNPKVDLMDAHLYLPASMNDEGEPEGAMHFAASNAHGFFDEFPTTGGTKKPFNEGEVCHSTSMSFGNWSGEIEKVFLNYDVSFHNEIWSGAFSGRFATGNTWHWERVQWWPGSLAVPPSDESSSVFLQHHPSGHYSNVEGVSNYIDVNGSAIEVKNHKLHHHFRPLADLLNHPSWQVYDFFNGDFTANQVYDDTRANELEAYYLKDVLNTVAIGWVHNRNSWVMNSYYLSRDMQNVLGCQQSDSSQITLMGFVPNTPLYITWFPTRMNATTYPPAVADTSSATGTLRLDLTGYLGGTVNSYLDTLQSDYAFVITPGAFEKSISNTHRMEVPLQILGWDFDMYPNPARGSVFLRTTDVLIKKVMLLDLAGRTVFVEDNVSSTAYNMPIDNLAMGAYWVRVSDGSNTKVKRLIVQ